VVSDLGLSTSQVTVGVPEISMYTTNETCAAFEKEVEGCRVWGQIKKG